MRTIISVAEPLYLHTVVPGLPFLVLVASATASNCKILTKINLL